MSISIPDINPRPETSDLKLCQDLGEEFVAVVRRALEEDIGGGDVTTNSIVSPDAIAVAQIIAKQNGSVSGVPIVQAVFSMLDDQMDFSSIVSDGAEVKFGQVLIELKGSTRAILTGERTALNFLGRMSGIATLTAQFVAATAGTKATILDTRKTAPGLRAVDKLAVRHGGGHNHRTGLYDMVLVKNNHIDSAGSISEALRLMRASVKDLEIEVEARNIKEVQEAIDLGVQRILLDNMSVAEMCEAVAINHGRAKLEASGKITLGNVRAVAETGVDFISIGVLTHSAASLDVSLCLVS